MRTRVGPEDPFCEAERFGHAHDRPLLIIEISPRGLFAPGNPEGQAFIDIPQAPGHAQVQLSGASA